MRKVVFTALVVVIAALISGGCDSKKSESAASSAPASAQPTRPATPAAQPTTPSAAQQPAVQQPVATQQPAATTPSKPPVAAAKDGVTLFRTCAACHGQKAEKPYPPGKNATPLTQLSKEQIVEALKNYKAGQRNLYGMGAMMKGNMSPFSESDMEKVAEYIQTLK